ncbi:MAG: ATP-binding protein, partial [Saprospiraceae bacterium]
LFVDNNDIFELTSDSLFARRVIVPNTGNIFRMFLGDGEKLFISTPISIYNQTYIHINTSWVKTPHLLDSLIWTDIFFDQQDHTYWVGMDNELRHYDIDFQLIRRYADSEEKLGAPWTVIPDGKGNVWFNNNHKAIGKININTGNITYLSDQDGYTPQSFEFGSPRGIMQGEELYFVGSSNDIGNIGFDRISLDKLVKTPPPHVYINSFKINKNQSSQAIDVNVLKDITLRYNENKLTIETGVIDYYSHRGNKIRYKLERNGSKAGWEYAPADYTIRYEELPPGKYNFQIQASNASNDYQGQLKTLNIIIKKAWWNTWIIRILSIVLMLSLVASVMYEWFQYDLRQKLKVELIRQKIAADLHDEIGSNLSSMTFSAELMKKKLVGTNQDIESILNNLVTNSRETSTLISDTIWSLNPKNDSFEKLIDRMKAFTHDMLSLRDIQYQFNSNGHGRVPILSLEQKRNIYLIYKEAINNIVKHSKANNVSIRIEPLQDNLHIDITDDGIGFDSSEIYPGNGLTNFKTRSRKEFCEVHYSSKIGLGTTVKITVPIKPKEQYTNGNSLTNGKSK